MKKIAIICILGSLAMFLSGCASPRWQIYRADYSYRCKDNTNDDYSTQNTILLDTRTGKTWLMSPSEKQDEADYYWLEMRQKR